MQRASCRQPGIFELLGVGDFKYGIVWGESIANGIEVNSYPGYVSTTSQYTAYEPSYWEQRRTYAGKERGACTNLELDGSNPRAGT
jgi:hypothetical protein